MKKMKHIIIYPRSEGNKQENQGFRDPSDSSVSLLSLTLSILILAVPETILVVLFT